MKKIHVIGIISLFLLCTPKSTVYATKIAGNLLVRMNGLGKMTDVSFKSETANREKPANMSSLEFNANVLNEMIAQMVIQEYIRQNGLDKTPKYTILLNFLKKDLNTEAMRNSLNLGWDQLEVKIEELKKEYNIEINGFNSAVIATMNGKPIITKAEFENTKNTLRRDFKDAIIHDLNKDEASFDTEVLNQLVSEAVLEKYVVDNELFATNEYRTALRDGTKEIDKSIFEDQLKNQIPEPTKEQIREMDNAYKNEYGSAFESSKDWVVAQIKKKKLLELKKEKIEQLKKEYNVEIMEDVLKKMSE